MTQPDDARSRILEAAGPIFADKGLQAATVREICDAAGVNVAAVNYYFGGKEPLYIEAVKAAHPVRLGLVAAPAWPADAPPAEKLRLFIRRMVLHLLELNEAPWQARLFIREITEPTPACRDLLREHFSQNFGVLLGILDEILPAGTPGLRRHQIGLSIVGQCVYYRAARKVIPLVVDEAEFPLLLQPDEIAAHVARFSLAALGLAPPLTESICGGERADEALPPAVARPRGRTPLRAEDRVLRGEAPVSARQPPGV